MNKDEKEKRTGAPSISIRLPSYYAVLPAKVRYDPDLPPNAKLLYAEITALAGEHGYWGREYACQAYILALGGNDLYGRGGMEVGEIGDICREDYRENKPTFAGYYGQIIQRLQEISPHAKFFLVTMPREEKQTRKAREQGDGHASLLREMAGFFPNPYVIALP